MPNVQHSIQQVTGFQVAGVHGGLKKNNALDFGTVVSDRPCITAGVFTTNHVKAAPVLVNQKRLAENPNSIRAVAINTVCANACTGQQGMQNAEQMADWVAGAIHCQPQQVLVMSTGVIGTQLPMEKIQQGIDLATQNLGNKWHNTASAIMTTDTTPKLASVSVTKSNGESYTIAGISKGSGMIAPNMATMLGIIVTDAQINQAQAQESLQKSTQKSFNRIVVDGDMSTNDMVILMANGASGVTVESDDLQQFQEALDAVSVKLAQDIVRDGEGVTKFVTLDIQNASDDESAYRIANTLATSMLLKTALYGEDANWGRIVAAAGRANVPFNPDCATLYINGGEISQNGNALQIFASGTPTNYREEDASLIMKEPSIYVTLDCGLGNGSAIVWTCDLSHEYVTINGDYRT